MEQQINNFTDEKLMWLHNWMMEIGARKISYHWIDEESKLHKHTITLNRLETMLKSRGYTKQMAFKPKKEIVESLGKKQV